MDKVNFLIKMVLKHEGGYANIKGDSGGETYMGIAKNSHPNWRGWKILDQYKPLKRNQIIDDKELNTLVYDVYEDDYYNPLKIYKINDLMISAHLMCHGVNAGNKSAAKLIQKSINNVYCTNISVDGIIGSNTLKYINMQDKIVDLANEFIKQRETFYNNIVKSKPSQKKFLKGWLNRINKTTQYVLDYTQCDSNQNILYANMKKNNNILDLMVSFLKVLFKKFFKS